jgi:hypothetical protein
VSVKHKKLRTGTEAGGPEEFDPQSFHKVNTQEAGLGWPNRATLLAVSVFFFFLFIIIIIIVTRVRIGLVVT